MFAPLLNRQAWIINLHWSQPSGIVPIGLPMRAMLNPVTQAVWLFSTEGEAQMMAAVHGVELEAVEEVTVVTFPEPVPDSMTVPETLLCAPELTCKYSDWTVCEVTDAVLGAQKRMAQYPELYDEGYLDTHEFLAELWRRGFKVVPNGDGRWKGDDNASVEREAGT